MLTRDRRFLGWLIVTCSILTVGFCREDNSEFGVMLVLSLYPMFRAIALSDVDDGDDDGTLVVVRRQRGDAAG